MSYYYVIIYNSKMVYYDHTLQLYFGRQSTLSMYSVKDRFRRMFEAAGLCWSGAFPWFVTWLLHGRHSMDWKLLS